MDLLLQMVVLQVVVLQVVVLQVVVLQVVVLQMVVLQISSPSLRPDAEICAFVLEVQQMDRTDTL